MAFVHQNVTLIGALTRDPEIRFSNAGLAIANGGIATVSSSWKDKQTDEWKEKVAFINFSAFGQDAENLAQSAAKGTRVMLVGRFETDQWETDEGEKRTALKFIVDEAAVSLKWATAQVEKVTRSQADEG